MNNVGFGQMEPSRKSTVVRTQQKPLTKAEVMLEIRDAQEKEKRILEDERKRAQSDFSRQKKSKAPSAEEDLDDAGGLS